MTGPALARDRSGRRYMIPDPPPDGDPIECPSVTTILNNIAKPALVNWSALEVAKYAYAQREVWHQLEEQAAVDLLKRAPYRDSRKKMNVGSAVHIAIDAHLKAGTQAATEQAPEIDDLDLLPYIAGALRFLDDHVHQVIRSEVTIVNLTYRYAGTVDLWAKLSDGRIAPVDWKTGKRLYPEHGLQVCAYANGEFAVNQDGTRHRLAPADLGIVVHLDGEGGYTAQPVETTPQLFKSFVALRTLQKYRDTLEDTVLGEPLPIEDRGDVTEWLAQQGVTTTAAI
jgi:hypothetical protein